MDRGKLLLSLLGIMLVASGVLAVYFFAQGSIIGEVGCDFSDVRSPADNQTYTASLEESTEQFREDYADYLVNEFDQADVTRDEALESFESFEFRMNDGFLQARNPNLACGQGGTN